MEAEAALSEAAVYHEIIRDVLSQPNGISAVAVAVGPGHGLSSVGEAFSEVLKGLPAPMSVSKLGMLVVMLEGAKTGEPEDAEVVQEVHDRAVPI